ncbi:MAG TPA: APC family permease [Chlamydiales bacterium]|nr:APC family permease [Chlamydiales bacterium]
MKKKISLFSLVCLVVAAIDSIRNLPAQALFGSSLIFFFLLSAILFLIPISLLSAELSSRYPEEGGVFHWVRHAFGEHAAMVAIWLQWINTVVWYPTILSFIAGTMAYLINPVLAQNKIFLACAILFFFWGLTLLNLLGIQLSARINSFCIIIGTLFPMALLIAFGIYWCASGHPLQIAFGIHDLIPHLGDSGNWISLIAIMASFLGIELAGVHVNDIKNPQKNFPKAMGYSVFILVVTILLGSLSIGMVIPGKEIRLVDGIMQTFTTFFMNFHIPVPPSILALLIIIGSLGGMINWLISPAKGLLQASHFGFLPLGFTKKNTYGVPVRIMITQAGLVSIFCLAFVLMPSINAFYWFLTALSTEMYMIMYIFMCAAGLKLGRPASGSGSFRMPKGTRTLTCFLGITACVLTIVVGFFPPEGINVGSQFHYVLMIGLGNIILTLPVIGICLGKRK